MSHEDFDVISAMRLYGGEFIQSLAETFCVADEADQARLKAAFADEWRVYAEVARRHFLLP